MLSLMKSEEERRDSKFSFDVAANGVKRGSSSRRGGNNIKKSK